MEFASGTVLPCDGLMVRTRVTVTLYVGVCIR